MKKYIILFLPLIFVLFSSKTYAYTNTDTAWIIENNNQKQRLQNTVCGNETAYDVIKDFIDNFDVDNAFANVEIYLTLQSGGVQTANNISFYVWPKSYPMRSEFWATGRPNYGTIQFTTEHYYETFTAGQYFYYIEIKAGNCSANSTNITSANGWQSFLTFVNTGILNSSQSTSTVSSFNKHSAGAFSPYWSDTIAVVNGSNLGVDIEESSFVIPYNWIYYTSRPFIYGYSSNCITSANLLCKNIILNGVEYTFGDTIPDTYTIDEGPPSPPEPSDSTYIDYLPSLGTIYNNFSPNDINNFDIDITFNTNSLTAYEYDQNLDYTWGCYGRKNNNNNYYSYERFSYCDFENNGDYDLSSNLLNINFQNLAIYDSNNNIITNFSSYDKLFFYVDFQYNDSSLDSTINNLSINSTGNNYYSQDLKGPIYDNFDLPLYFKLFVSTNRANSSYFSIRYSGTTLTDRYFIYKQQYNTTSLNSIGSSSFLSSTFQQLYVSNDSSIGFMFYHQISNQNSGIDLPSLDLVLNESIIISINNTSNNFYYYDSSGTIVNDNIEVIYDNNESTNFNLDYYFNKVYEYELEYFDKINKLHDIIQDFYDSLPIFIQTTFFILFILFCTYFVYREARR